MILTKELTNQKISVRFSFLIGGKKFEVDYIKEKTRGKIENLHEKVTQFRSW